MKYLIIIDSIEDAGKMCKHRIPDIYMFDSLEDTLKYVYEVTKEFEEYDDREPDYEIYEVSRTMWLTRGEVEEEAAIEVREKRAYIEISREIGQEIEKEIRAS